MENQPKPSLGSIRKWHEAVLKHSMNVEFYTCKKSSVIHYPYNIFNEMNKERPHDVAGDYNKLEPEIVRGLAMQFEEGGFGKYKDLIMAAVELHRNQLHHRIFNDPDSMAAHKSEYDKFLCGLDAVCSLLEFDVRAYQGGTHSLDGIKEVITKNPEHKQPWMTMAFEHVAEIGPVNLGEISLGFQRNIGVPEDIYEEIIGKVKSSFDSYRAS